MIRMIRNCAFVLLAVIGLFGRTVVRADDGGCPFDNGSYYDGYNINGGQCDGTGGDCNDYCSGQNWTGWYCNGGYLQCGPWDNCGYCQCSGCVPQP
jgi:hypothetical protein